jgi:hypothetical protein
MIELALDKEEYKKNMAEKGININSLRDVIKILSLVKNVNERNEPLQALTTPYLFGKHKRRRRSRDTCKGIKCKICRNMSTRNSKRRRSRRKVKY